MNADITLKLSHHRPKYKVLQQKVSFLCGKNAGDILKLKISCVDYVTVDKLAVDNVLFVK